MITLYTSPDQVVLLEVGEGIDEVRVEQSEEDEVRGDGGLGDLQAGQAAQARHRSQEAGLLPGVSGRGLDAAVSEGGGRAGGEGETGQQGPALHIVYSQTWGNERVIQVMRPGIPGPRWEMGAGPS